MSKLKKSSALVTTLILSSSFSLPVQAKNSSFEQIFVFGHSISDTGNLFNLTGGVFPPPSLYYEGRFADDPVWIDYLSEDLGLNPSNFYGGGFTGAAEGINFAVGGATTSTTTLGDTAEVSFPGVTTQVNDFIDFLDGETISEDALVTLWAGENDYVEAFQNGQTFSPATPINNIANSLSQLANAGAKNVLVANLVNLADTPLGQSFLPPEQLEQLTLLTNAHNAVLNSAVNSLGESFPATNFAILDINSLLNDIFANPLDFGFNDNPLASCLSPNSFPNIAPDAVACANPEQFVYYDNQHFTSAVHELVAESARVTIKQEFDSHSTIPESGNAIALIGLGLGILGGLAKKHN